VSDLNVGIEGHTDNVPITHSGWKSNWELSTARALSVLHHLEDNEGISPKRLSATGYGEFRPVASNATKAGKQDNRRVEIVILPKTMPGR
ncbi:MAG: OmpA family protein, partial [Candidatus Omnitrophica bacterium]|nr:OmpA family protein [Candidatus Omnitrophota bacterium]